MSGQKILFLRDHEAFIDALEGQGYNVVLASECGGTVARQVLLEGPDLIVIFADGFDCDGIDPVRDVPESHLERMLAVPGDLDPDEFLEWVQHHLSYIL